MRRLKRNITTGDGNLIPCQLLPGEVNSVCDVMKTLPVTQAFHSACLRAAVGQVRAQVRLHAGVPSPPMQTKHLVVPGNITNNDH